MKVQKKSPNIDILLFDELVGALLLTRHSTAELIAMPRNQRNVVTVRARKDAEYLSAAAKNAAQCCWVA